MKTLAWIVLVSALTAVGIAAGIRAQDGIRPNPAVHSFADIVKRNPIDRASGRTITTVESGSHSTVTVWQFRQGIPPHLHRDHDEVIYCVSGEGTARLGDRSVKIKAGDFVVIPPGVPHSVIVTGKTPMRGISVFSPAFDGKDRVPVR